MYYLIFCALLSNAASINGIFWDVNCDGQCGEGDAECDTDADCLPGFKCINDDGYFFEGESDYCTRMKCYGEPECCVGQCREGEGDCDYNEDCHPGFECKHDWDYLDLIYENDTCTEEFRNWDCDQFPEWLQKSYRIRGMNFCKDQWNANWTLNGEIFDSQPKCNDKVLPTISFYDAVEII